MKAVNAKNPRIYSLDLLKVIATVLIILHHYQQITGAWFDGGLNFFNGRFYFGYMVELFFILSGLFMVRYIEKIRNGLTLKSFFLKRQVRLLPVVATAAVVYELLLFLYVRCLGMEWMGRTPSIWGMIIDGLGIQSGWVFENPYVNNPTWYIAVLLLCYIVFYLVTMITQKMRISARYGYIVIILIGCGISTYAINLPLLNEYTCRGYYAFFTGVLLGTYIQEQKISKKITAIAAGICLMMMALFVYDFSMISYGLNYLLTFVFYPALVIVFLSKPVKRTLSNPLLGKWGEISFDAYVWHVPVLLGIHAAEKLFGFTLNFASIKTMIAYCIVCEIVGLLSYLLIEVLPKRVKSV